MTTQKHDQSEEEAFDDFLQGRGELVKQLKALSQLSPSAALDAAILASAKAAVAQAARSQQAAANDPVSPGKPGFLSRFRMPLAMAASLMVAVLVAVQWHAQSEYTAPIQVAQAPAAASADAVPQVTQQDAKEKAGQEEVNKNVPATTPSVAAAEQSNSVAESRAQRSEKKAAARVAANEAEKSAAERANAASTQLAQADTSSGKSSSALIQDEKPAAAPAADAAQSGLSSLRREAPKAAVSTAQAPSAAPVESPAKPDPQEKQKAWIARIEELIKAGSRDEALAQWEKFEKSYPNYAAYSAPEKLKAQIKALKN